MTATWNVLPSGAYLVGGEAPSRQPRSSHPVLVDRLLPLRPAARMETMLEILATSLAERIPVSWSHVVINHGKARSGRVFDAGEIVRW